ncbi:hypothetical protein [Actinomadura kijaniata]|uniref:hypothetical protein n=1 Tax=Actinomadura kijaniata TaxID=46161 RepID=UPI0012FA8092|nr:hypothetical protein [Actinomadura kijaniata]
MKTTSVAFPSVVALVATLLTGCSSDAATPRAVGNSAPKAANTADQDLRQADCLRIEQAVKARHPSKLTTDFVFTAEKIMMDSFREVHPHLKHPDVVNAVDAIFELDRQLAALDDGGISDARGKLQLRLIDAVGNIFKVCGGKSPLDDIGDGPTAPA